MISDKTFFLQLFWKSQIDNISTFIWPHRTESVQLALAVWLIVGPPVVTYIDLLPQQLFIRKIKTRSAPSAWVTNETKHLTSSEPC